MYKHKYDYTIVLDGKRYPSKNGIVELPRIVEGFNPIEKPKKKKVQEDAINS